MLQYKIIWVVFIINSLFCLNCASLTIRGHGGSDDFFESIYQQEELRRLKSFVEELEHSVDSGVNPCENFVAYSTNKMQPSLIGNPWINRDRMEEAFDKFIINGENLTVAESQAKSFFESCYVNFEENFITAIENVEVKEVIMKPGAPVRYVITAEEKNNASTVTRVPLKSLQDVHARRIFGYNMLLREHNDIKTNREVCYNKVFRHYNSVLANIAIREYMDDHDHKNFADTLENIFNVIDNYDKTGSGDAAYANIREIKSVVKNLHNELLDEKFKDIPITNDDYLSNILHLAAHTHPEEYPIFKHAEEIFRSSVMCHGKPVAVFATFIGPQIFSYYHRIVSKSTFKVDNEFCDDFKPWQVPYKDGIELLKWLSVLHEASRTIETTYLKQHNLTNERIYFILTAQNLRLITPFNHFTSFTNMAINSFEELTQAFECPDNSIMANKTVC